MGWWIVTIFLVILSGLVTMFITGALVTIVVRISGRSQDVARQMIWLNVVAGVIAMIAVAFYLGR